MGLNGKVPQRGEIWWAALDPTLGAEIRKTRPCLILSMDVVNRNRRTVLAVPLSSSARENPPITVYVTCRGKRAVAVVDQLRAISRERLRGYIEDADPEEVSAVTQSLLAIVTG